MAEPTPAPGGIRSAVMPSFSQRRQAWSGAPPPKHGLLLAHPLVRDAPRRERGRMARKLAAKAAIAARLDCYGGEPQGEALLERLQDGGRPPPRAAARRPDDPVK